MNPRTTTICAAAAITVGAGLTTGPAAAATDRHSEARWSATWSSSVQQAVPSGDDTMGPNWSMDGFNDQTLRQHVRISAGGSRVRIRLSNRYGTQPLHITGATLARTSTGPAIQPGTLRTLTFHGAPSTTIPAGQAISSDPAGLPVTPLESLTITLYLAGPTGPATFHDDGLTTTYRATGDHRLDTGAAAFDGPTSHSFYYLTGVDVTGTPSRGTVVAFGDSITNGHNSTVDGNARYTDDLAQRLVTAHRRMAVANEGMSGNLLLNELPCFGETGVTRFQHDVLDQPGVRTVIVMEGSNDIWDSQGNFGCGTTPRITSEQLIDGYQMLIDDAHARGIRVVGATILPFKASYMSPTDFQRAEAIRDQVNTWTLGSGAYDAVVDFAAAVADPTDPRQLNPAYNSGDSLHPNDAGYAAIADAINLSAL